MGRQDRGGLLEIQPCSNLHFVWIAEVVDADQSGNRQVVGLGDLGEGLPLGHSVLRGSRDRGYGHRLEAGLWENGITGQFQVLTDFHVVCVAEAIDGHQVSAAHLVLACNPAEGFSLFNSMSSLASTHTWPWNLKLASRLQVVGIAHVVEPHQGAHTHARAVSNIRERFTGSHRNGGGGCR